MKKTALFLTVIFVLSCMAGCANIHDDSTRTKTEGTGAGALAGGAIGALLGQVIGHDTASTLIGAAVGAAVGGVGGYAYGSYVADQKEKYANEEDWYNASIAEAEERNSQLAEYNRGLKTRVAELQQATDSLKARYKEKKVEKEQLLAEKENVDKLKKEADERLSAAKKELNAQNSVMAEMKKDGGNSDFEEPLSSQIKSLKANIKALEKRTQELASMSEAMSV